MISVQCAVCIVHLVLCNVQCFPLGVLCSVCCVKTVESGAVSGAGLAAGAYTVPRPLVQPILYTVHCTLYNTLYTVQCTLYTVI